MKKSLLFSTFMLAAGFMAFSVVVNGNAMARGTKTCKMHRVLGESKYHTTKRGAERGAVRGWRNHVNMLYGRRWTNASLSAIKTMNCWHDNIGWKCWTRAQPCHR